MSDYEAKTMLRNHMRSIEAELKIVRHIARSSDLSISQDIIGEILKLEEGIAHTAVILEKEK